jgi:site-specific DNA-methyltransferase (adenine-specific)
MIISGAVKFHDDLADLLVPIETISPHPDNPNNGDTEAIAESIQINGMYRPVYVQDSTSYVLAGNTTYAACLSLEADQIPVIRLRVDNETAHRILLGDNQLARLAVLDAGLLQGSLEALLETELGLLGTGFTDNPPSAVETMPNPNHTVIVSLTGDDLDRWFDLPGQTDRDRLLGLLDRP